MILILIAITIILTPPPGQRIAAYRRVWCEVCPQRKRCAWYLMETGADGTCFNHESGMCLISCQRNLLYWPPGHTSGRNRYRRGYILLILLCSPWMLRRLFGCIVLNKLYRAHHGNWTRGRYSKPIVESAHAAGIEGGDAHGPLLQSMEQELETLKMLLAKDNSRF